jgi:hypothetical protein
VKKEKKMCVWKEKKEKNVWKVKERVGMVDEKVKKKKVTK